MTTLGNWFCQCTQPRYCPEDEPEMIWSSSLPKQRVAKKSSEAVVAPGYQSQQPQNTNYINYHLHHFQSRPLPLRRTSPSTDTDTTVTMNTNSFVEQDWSDDDDSACSIRQRAPELALATPIKSIDERASGCASFACSYATTALAQSFDDDDDILEDSRHPSIYRSLDETIQEDKERHPELPRAWTL